MLAAGSLSLMSKLDLSNNMLSGFLPAGDFLLLTDQELLWHHRLDNPLN